MYILLDSLYNTYIQSNITHVYFNQLIYPHSYATYFDLYLGHR